MSDNGELYNATRATRNNTTEAALTVSMKAGKGLDAPWVIVKADTAEQLLTHLNALEGLYIFQAVSRLSKSLLGAYEHEMER